LDTAIYLLERYGLLVVFINLLLTEGGLPLPAYPTLATAAAMMGGAGYDAFELIATGVGASLLADGSCGRCVNCRCRRTPACVKQKACSPASVSGRCCLPNSSPE
jgi:hypothetical protein